MKAAVLGAGEPHFDAHIATLQQLPEVESNRKHATANYSPKAHSNE